MEIKVNSPDFVYDSKYYLIQVNTSKRNESSMNLNSHYSVGIK